MNRVLCWSYAKYWQLSKLACNCFLRLWPNMTLPPAPGRSPGAQNCFRCSSSSSKAGSLKPSEISLFLETNLKHLIMYQLLNIPSPGAVVVGSYFIIFVNRSSNLLPVC